MQELPTDSEQERQASADVLLDYVTTVVTHFRGRLDSLDVVNEPFGVDQGLSLQENIWYRVFGPSYPAIVSRTVHDADPDVRQFINENGADVPGPRQDALLQLRTRRVGASMVWVFRLTSTTSTPMPSRPMISPRRLRTSRMPG